MKNIIEIKNLNKTYKSGFQALFDINLEIHKGEIFALLGPNGAGKTTLISTICGIVNPTSGSIEIDCKDIVKNYRECRSKVGLVPQELTTEAFETVWNTVNLSRGLFGKPSNPELLEKILKDLSLWDKKDNKIMTLSGGMKRRVLIAKALSHEPEVLFLDEPTAGVDVDLRKSMWKLVHQMRERGVTIILTTHYIDEAEEMADRVGVINNGRIIIVDEKEKLMRQMGSKMLTVDLQKPLGAIPEALSKYDISIENDGNQIKYVYDARANGGEVQEFFDILKKENLNFSDISTKQSSLEEIFVNLVKQ